MLIVLHIVWMALLGLGVGFFSAGLGLGGGVIMMPAFITFLPGMDVHTAKGTSLFIILLVAATGFPRVRRLQRQRPHYSAALLLAAGALAGGYIGAVVTTRVSGNTILLLFLAFVAFMMWQLMAGEPKSVMKRPVQHRRAMLLLIGVAAGATGSATGTGGGSVLAPMILITGLLPHTQMVYSANQVMIATSLAAAPAHFLADQVYFEHYTIGHVCLGIIPVIFIFAQIGIFFGAWANRHMRAEWRRRLLALVLALVGLRMLLELLL